MPNAVRSYHLIYFIHRLPIAKDQSPEDVFMSVQNGESDSVHLVSLFKCRHWPLDMEGR